MLLAGLLPLLQSDLVTRSEQCPPSYIAPNGLNFTTYCSTDLPCPNPKPVGCDLTGSKKVSSMQECLNYCATNKVGCYGVSYSTTDGSCYLKGNYTTTKLSSSNSTINSALVDRSQLQPLANLSCPHPDSSTFTTRGGMQVKMLCDVYLTTSSFCPWGSICPQHTSTFDDCLDICQAAHPLCTGVTWNPDMIGGYGNCYLRNDRNAATAVPNNAIMHSAKLTSGALQAANASLSSGSWNTSTNGAMFDVLMFDQRTDASNYTALHSASIESCMESCAQRMNELCLGVLFDMSLTNGYENCYLLNATGSPNRGANFTFAQINGTRSYITPGESQTGGASSTSLAWIAGPVIGGVVLLAVLVTTSIFLARRRERRTKQVYEYREKSTDEGFVSHIFEAPDGARKKRLDEARELYSPQDRPLELPVSRAIFELPAVEQAK